MASAPITVRSGLWTRVQASFRLLSLVFKVIRQDSELLAVPVIGVLIMLLLFGLLLVATVVTIVVYTITAPWQSAIGVVFVAGSYIIVAFGSTIMQAMVTHTVVTRASGANPTLRQSLFAALRHLPTLLLWSTLAGSVGALLRALSERAPFVGIILLRLTGIAWNTALYFVVPIIVTQHTSVVTAMKQSVITFTRTWGEMIVSNVTLSAAWMVLHLVVLGALFVLLVLTVGQPDVPVLVSIIAPLFLIIWLVVSYTLQVVMGAVLRVLLYLYAEGQPLGDTIPAEVLSTVLVRSSSDTVITSRTLT